MSAPISSAQIFSAGGTSAPYMSMYVRAPISRQPASGRMQELYSAGNLQDCCRQLMTLPFLPEDQVTAAFDFLIENANVPMSRDGIDPSMLGR